MNIVGNLKSQVIHRFLTYGLLTPVGNLILLFLLFYFKQCTMVFTRFKKKKNQFISIIIIFTIMVVCAFGKLMKIAKHHLPLVVFLVLEDTYII